jgi:large-conductance mechanosensitive channel
MSNSNETNSTDLNSIKTGRVLVILVGLGLVIVGFYYVNFQYLPEINEVWWPFFQYLSEKNEDWGTFGDYVGGILNPVIAAFAFYLIAKTYELQKRELEETRKLLEVSTDAQNNQVKLAALTALLNSNLTKISLFKSEGIELRQQQGLVGSNILPSGHDMAQDQREHLSEIRRMLVETENKINELKEKNDKLEEQIEVLGKEKIEQFYVLDL